MACVMKVVSSTLEAPEVVNELWELLSLDCNEFREFGRNRSEDTGLLFARKVEGFFCTRDAESCFEM